MEKQREKQYARDVETMKRVLNRERDEGLLYKRVLSTRTVREKEALERVLRGDAMEEQ